MATLQHMCTLCKEGLLENPAETWCPECETFLCSDCDRHHKRNRASKHHKTVSTEVYGKLPDNVQKASNVCSYHELKLEMYCPNHSCACCLQCFTEKHSGCGEVKQLTEVVKNIKSSVRVSSLETELDDLKADNDIILKHMHERLEAVETDKSEGLAKIRGMREKVDKYMNAVEQNLEKSLSSEHDKIRSEITNTLADAEIRLRVIKDSRNSLKTIVDNATDLQVYHGLDNLEKVKLDQVNYIEKLKNSGNLNNKNLGVNISDSLSEFFLKVEHFGIIENKSTSSNLSLTTGKKSIVQYAASITDAAVDIDDIYPTSMKSYFIPYSTVSKPGITGCAVLDNKDILLLDTDNRKLYRFTADGVFQRIEYHFDNKPADICLVKENKIAVTLVTSKTLMMINLSNDEKIYEKTFPGNCVGVCSNNTSIAVVIKEDSKTKVYLLNIVGEILNSIDFDQPNWERVYLYHDKIFLSNWHTHKVMCCHQNGNVIWELSNDILRKPLDLAVDCHDFVYVVCRKNNSLVALSPDGSKNKVMLSKKDGILDPVALSINQTNGQMCVANRGDRYFHCFTLSKNI